MRDISPLVNEILPRLVAIRRDLHAHPELGYEETETARKVLAVLRELPGLEIREQVAGTGIVATLDSAKPGPCIALRADMDALPIEEATNKPYASTVPGKMHACGHDGHTTCLLGAVMILARIRDELDGPVKFIFQPAEEGGAGGDRMCREGALERPNVAAIVGLHGFPDLRLGEVGCSPGPNLAGSTRFSITIRGRGAHAAMPHRGIDPIVIASQIVLALQTIVSRATDPLASVVVTVGQLHAGTASNVIPESAHLVGTVRALDPKLLAGTAQKVSMIARLTAEAHGGVAEVELEEGYPPLVNDRGMTEYLLEVARDTLGAARVVRELEPIMGAEDFAFYLGRIPGTFWRLGLAPKDGSRCPGLHAPTFDFNDDAIETGVRLHVESARRFARTYRV